MNKNFYKMKVVGFLQTLFRIFTVVLQCLIFELVISIVCVGLHELYKHYDKQLQKIWLHNLEEGSIKVGNSCLLSAVFYTTLPPAFVSYLHLSPLLQMLCLHLSQTFIMVILHFKANNQKKHISLSPIPLLHLSFIFLKS